MKTSTVSTGVGLPTDIVFTSSRQMSTARNMQNVCSLHTADAGAEFKHYTTPATVVLQLNTVVGHQQLHTAWDTPTTGCATTLIDAIHDARDPNPTVQVLTGTAAE